MTVYQSIAQLTGNTPLMQLINYGRDHSLEADLIAKLEFFNPAGSIKDRIAKAMLDDAEKAGRLDADTVLIEPTSGNTGIGLAALSAARGNRLIITMPETMSAERIKLMKVYGAEVVLTEGSKGMQGAIERANELLSEIDNSLILSQFSNPANPKAHFDGTGPEIWEAIEGKVDVFVAGVGTGGTLSGAGRYLKQKNPSLYVVAVEPASSPVLSKGRKGSHGIQGIGAGFVPETLDTSVYDEIVAVADEEAFETGRQLALCEGLLVGISSGAAVAAATELARRPENKGKNIVVILPDTGERYLSTAMFDFS